jgi:hypothetical protein
MHLEGRDRHLAETLGRVGVHQEPGKIEVLAGEDLLGPCGCKLADMPFDHPQAGPVLLPALRQGSGAAHLLQGHDMAGEDLEGQPQQDDRQHHQLCEAEAGLLLARGRRCGHAASIRPADTPVDGSKVILQQRRRDPAGFAGDWTAEGSLGGGSYPWDCEASTGFRRVHKLFETPPAAAPQGKLKRNAPSRHVQERGALRFAYAPYGRAPKAC